MWLGLLVVAAAAFEVARRRLLAPEHLVGDEAEYIARRSSADPYSKEPFLRAPGMTWIVLRCRSVSACRWWMSASGTAAVVCTGGAAHALTGSVLAGAIAALLMLALPDRVVLSSHLWPDVPATALHAALAWLLLASAADRVSPAVAIAGMAVVGAVLPLLRIDTATAAAIACALLAGHWWWVVAPASTLLTVIALSAFHSARHGIRSPDTTGWFNLTLLAATTAAGERQPLEPSMTRCYGRWLAQTDAERADDARQALRALVAGPGRTLWQLTLRTGQLLGPDTFATQVLLHPDDGAYPSLSPRRRRWLQRALQWSFTVLIALSVAGATHGGTAAASAVAGAAGVLVASAVNARTRFRRSALPWLVVPAATYLWRPDIRGTAVLVIAFVVLLAVRHAAGPRAERHVTGGVTGATRCDGTMPIHFPHV